MTNRISKGSSKGGQFTFGDDRRDEAGPIVLEAVSSDGLYDCDYEIAEMLKTGNDSLLYERWAEDTGDEYFDADSQEAIDAAYEEGVDWYDMTGKQQADFLREHMDDSDNSAKYEDALYATNMSFAHNESKRVHASEHELVEHLRGLGVSVDHPDIRDNIRSAIQHRYDDLDEVDVEVRWDGSVGDVFSAMESGEPVTVDAYVVLNDEAEIAVGRVPLNVDAGSMRIATRPEGSKSHLAVSRDRFGLERGQVVLQLGNVTHYADGRKVTVTGNKAEQSWGNATVNVTRHDDGTVERKMTTHGSNFDISEEMVIRQDGTYVKNVVHHENGRVSYSLNEVFNNGVLTTEKTHGLTVTTGSRYSDGTSETTITNPSSIQTIAQTPTRYWMSRINVSNGTQVEQEISVDGSTIVGTATGPKGPSRLEVRNSQQHITGKFTRPDGTVRSFSYYETDLSQSNIDIARKLMKG